MINEEFLWQNQICMVKLSMATSMKPISILKIDQGFIYD